MVKCLHTYIYTMALANECGVKRMWHNTTKPIVSQGSIHLRNITVLVLGNTEIIKFPGVSRANLFGNLIDAIIKQHLSIKLLIAGALPRPDEELRITPHIKYQNASTSKNCQCMKDNYKYDITYIAAYKIYLERYRCYDESKGSYKPNVCIIRPYGTYYVVGGLPLLNDVSFDKRYNAILQRLHLPHPGPVWVDMPEVEETPEVTDLRDDNRKHIRGLY